MMAPSLPTDRTLRAIVLEALEELARAERGGPIAAAADAFARVVAELRARTVRTRQAALAIGRTDRLVRVERRNERGA